MNFSTWSIRNPIPAILLFILLTVAGIFSFHQLPIQNFPDLDFPTVNVTLIQPGASAAQLETEVVRKVEDSLVTLTGVKHITSSIHDGVANITVEFVLERTLSDALVEVKGGVDRIRSFLPQDLEQPNIVAISISNAPLETFSISSSDKDEEALSWFVDDTVSRTLLAVPGVGRFARLGGVRREIRIEVDPTRLIAQGVTAAEVSQALKRNEEDASGGRGQIGQIEQSVRTSGAIREVGDLTAYPISLSDGRRIRIDQVANVSDSVAERSQVALMNGRHVVGFQVYRAKGYDESHIDEGIREALDTLKKKDPGLTITPVSSQVTHTMQQYDGSMTMLYEGAILAVLVVWWFLRDWRATLVAASALPLSILPAFAAMNIFGFSLNTVTMLALAVIVGILVDDAIVEIENIERHSRMGKPLIQAAEEAVNEIALAVIATTMTLVAVFVPTATMKGVPGLFFKQFGWTAVIAVMASLLVARLLTPMMAAYLMKDYGDKPVAESRLTSWYVRLVTTCLRRRKTTLFAALLFFFGSLALVPLLPAGFIPAIDKEYATVNAELPAGSSLNASVAVAEAARLAVKDIPGVKSVFTTIGVPQVTGGGNPVPGEVRRATLTLLLQERGHRPKQAVIEKDIRNALLKVPGARFNVGDGDVGQKLELILTGNNEDALTNSARELERQLRGVAGLSSIISTASLDRPEIVIRPDASLASERGINTATISETVRVATVGDFEPALAKLNLDNRQVDIRVRVPDADRQNLDAIGELRVRGRNGLVPISAIAGLSIKSGPSQIDRYDRRRFVNVSADLGSSSLGDALNSAKELPAITHLPDSVQLIESGDAEIMVELFNSFGLAILTGILCVYCVLVLLFKDFFQPITILSSLPLSLGGAFVALLLTGAQFNLPTLIGLVMLMGIVTKNSILLVEYTIMGIRDYGMNQFDALIDACRKRARPIVMTTVAMTAGMLPIASGLGFTTTFRQSMAIAVIGGLITSTALSLLVVPVVFIYVARMAPALKRLTSRNRVKRIPAGTTDNKNG